MRIIAGEARGRVIDAPSGLQTRPTLDRVRENIFNILQYEVPGSHVLDLFAGSGALSLEAISRGAADAVLVDSDRNACLTQKNNAEKLRFDDRIRILHCDCRKALETLKKEEAVFDLVFLDPPYSMVNLRGVFEELIPLIHQDSLLIHEYEAGKEIIISNRFVKVKDRSWGFCAAAIYRMTTQGG